MVQVENIRENWKRIRERDAQKKKHTQIYNKKMHRMVRVKLHLIMFFFKIVHTSHYIYSIRQYIIHEQVQAQKNDSRIQHQELLDEDVYRL